MGMFTTIITRDGRHLQMKCGYDECSTYWAGQLVDSYICPDRPGEGYMLDGVYEGFGEHEYTDYIVIKGGQVLVESLKLAQEAAENAGVDVYGFLKQKYDVQDPDPSLWTEAAWEAKRAREAGYEAEKLAFQESIAHLSPGEQRLQWFMRPLMRQRDWASIGRKVFVVEPLLDTTEPNTESQD